MYTNRLRARSGKESNADNRTEADSDTESRIELVKISQERSRSNRNSNKQYEHHSSYRQRAASCSRLNPKENSQETAFFGENNTHQRKDKNLAQGDPEIRSKTAEIWKQKQLNLCQQRINLFLNEDGKRVNALSDSDDSSLFRSLTLPDLTAVSTKPSFEKERISVKDFLSSRLKEQTRELANKGSVTSIESFISTVSTTDDPVFTHVTEEPLDKGLNSGTPLPIATSLTGEKERTDLSTTKEIMAAGQSQTEKDKKGKQPVEPWQEFLLGIKEELKTQVSDSEQALRRDFNQGIDEVKNTQTSIQTSITAIQEAHDLMKQELATARNELKTCKIELQNVKNVSIRQSHLIKECTNTIEVLKKQVNRDYIKIIGIKKVEGENVTEVVADFFKNKMKITKEIKLLDAYRVGKGDFSPIIVHLQNFRERGLIFSQGKQLQGLKNEAEKPYLVRDYETIATVTKQKRNARIKAQNNKIDSTAERLALSFEKSRLMVNGQEYKKAVEYPECSDILKPTTAMLAEQLKVNLSEGDLVKVDDQEFYGYATDVRSVKEVQSAYQRVASKHADARHVLAAWRIPGLDHHVLQDCCDDSEYGVGADLLDLLETSNIENKAVFVVRYYDGTHIGPKRIDAILDAARSAIVNKPFNSVTEQHQYPATIGDIRKGKFRGRGRGRGGYL